jgi:transglutaminase-like putative cysteine protease
MRRSVSCRLGLDINASSDVVLAVSVASTLRATDSLSLALDGVEVSATELHGGHGTRLHRATGLPTGMLSVSYDATVLGRASQVPVDDFDVIRYVRPSRYCESDRLAGFAHSEFRGLQGRALLDAVSSWVGTRVMYVAGSSRPIDGAVSTLLSQEGVCRDFAHLVIAILRARDVPARMVSVYAPGLEPMDFHAVVEAYVAGQWLVVDATCLAPRSALVRIATGRDAADTAFLTSLSGSVTVTDLVVTALVDSTLPSDDMTAATTLG